MAILGIGFDLVTVSEFAEQLSRPGTAMKSSFRPGERRYCEAKADPARHYAVRWAAKEAVIKAWASSRFARPPSVGDNAYVQVEVVNDAWGRPSIKLHDEAAQFLPGAIIHLSLTHDGDMAGAMVVIEEPDLVAPVAR
ncbi:MULTISPECIES: holo-ACP synthase AcpS [Rhodococcus]|jgi:holo-[acyl-carrier protein] synthase|uniref:Holo-[acyl-carrier-protein] synthase n=1 Tax=Rhodococcus gannanensis TaxID=1960308 RepID=A0ABW4PBM4_9NOCA|nr:4'-phosphopantetheinyl transferase [Rhodococcus triatomae BKS 15-14]